MGFTEIEKAGKQMFEQFPVIKRSAKRVYQLASVATSNEKFKSEGDVVKVSPDDGYEYFYGYYDKSPWDATDRYMICIKVKQAYKSVAPKEPGVVGLIDTANGNKFYKIGTTHSWNVQQSCMAQWMGPDFKSRIIYNDFRDGKYCSVIYSLKTKNEEKVLPLPVYDVARDGSFALSLDFSRLHRMRPGYGYSNLPESTKGELCPDKPCIWKMDIETGEVMELFKYTDLAAFEPDESMVGAEHKVNHLMISPNGKRFMVLHRWFQKGRKHTRLVTVNVDKTEMYNLSDDVFVSHCYWKNDEEILSFLRKKTGDHYYLMKDQTQEYKMYWPELNTDGHCSYSPDGSLIITDTYPNRKRIASVYLCTENDNRSRRIARVFAPFRYDNDCRCDLHPRWNRAGDKICIDSVHDGKRGLYVIDIKKESESINEKKATQETDSILVSCVIPTYKRSDMLVRAVNSVLNQTHKNIEVLVVDDNEPNDEYSIEVQEKINNIKDDRVHYVQQEKHINGAVARNVGIKAAKGEFVAFLDDDDEWLPEKIERQLVYLKQNPDCRGCSCLYTFYKDGKPTKKCPPYTNDNLLFKILSRSVQMFTSTILLDKETLVNSGMFDEDLVRHQDLQMLADFASISNIAVLNEYLVKIHKDSDINRPNTKKTIEVKRLYLSKMGHHIKGFDKKSQKRIYGAHYFEIVVQAAKEKKIGTVIKYLIKIGPSISAYKDVYARYTSKKNNACN
ncbi:MAG: glycosyltransferase family 2 protein [Clostridiales bacterium]|nr:glycosyltransferase family 2 protein [Clostridiales bacterium]